ncbi:MAG: hypothetical protein ACTS9Y_14140 [Methylophilus sp.]|uniref:hypothetical protein n=1 Tax=Methylophilus sp. TaxID=29541 RepID=UPI003FA09A2E
MNILKTVLLVNLALLSNLSHALVMPAAGSSLIVDQRETLYVNDGDVFDLSSLSITSSGGIDIFGNTQNASFSIVANSFINIAGYLNLFVSDTTLHANEIDFSGILNIIGGGRITFIPKNRMDFSGSIMFDGVSPPSFPPQEGPLIGPQLPPKVILSAVPEAENYVLLLAGLSIIGMARRRHSA